MYKIYCDNELIFDLSSDVSLISPILKLQDNNAGTLEFSIVPENILYDEIKKMKSEIKVLSDGKPIFIGRPIDETIDFKNCKKVTCEGALAYLNDSIQRPAEYHNLSIRAYLETLVGYHNQQISDDRLKFNVGIVTVHDDNDSIYKYTNWETTLQVIKTDLVDKYGGHLRVRIEGDTKYLDYLKDYPRTNTQVIEFGTNLLDFTKNIDATQIVTAVIPLGARLEESTIKKLEERVTIKSVNNNLDYVASKSAVDTYGWIFKTVTWDNVHKPLILKHKGEEYLKSIQFEKVVLKVKAIDLHMVNVDIEQIELLDEVRVISKPNGLDKVFPVSEMTIDMSNPQANTITLGNTGIQAMSGSAVSSNNEIMKRIDEIPSIDEAVSEAVKNATELINNALNGHVVKRKDELLIMDTADMDTAKKVWRWNLNGLAYSNNGYKGPYETAITMDGSIVANRITTGVLNGGYVKLDLTRGTFLIGRNDNDFLLKFDGEKLQFGNGTLSKDALEQELLEALKGEDGDKYDIGEDGYWYKNGQKTDYKAIGQDGENGHPGTPGKDGKTPYFHIAWADNENGSSGFTTSGGKDKAYMGTYTDFTERDSTDYHRYTWVKVKGQDGENGRDGEDGRDGKSFKYNLISNGDFHNDFTKNKVGYNSKKLNEWQVKGSTELSKVTINAKNGESELIVRDGRVEVNQYLNLKSNTKYYIKADVISSGMSFYYHGKSYVALPTVKNTDKEIYKTYHAEFTTHDSESHYIQLDCREKSKFKNIILSEEPISDETDWYPSKFDGVGKKGKDGERGAQGPPGRDGRDGRDGSLAELPPALKAWNGGATNISGKYVFTPELFVGTNGDSQYLRTGIYVGHQIKARDLFGDFTNFDGITGIYKGSATWHLSVEGNGWIGNSGRAMYWNKEGELRLPKIKASEIEAGTITTDMIYPGNSNRIVLEKGYSPGSNEAMSIDANNNAIRLKYSSGSYVRVDKNGVGCYSEGTQEFFAGGGYNGVSVNEGTVMELGYRENNINIRHGDGFFVNYGNGNTVLQADNGGVQSKWGYLGSSDVKLKENICKIDCDEVLRKNEKVTFTDLTSDDAYSFLKDTSLFNYNYKEDTSPRFSLITQLVKGRVRDFMIKYNKFSKSYSVELYNYISIIHAGIQAEIKRNDELQNKVNRLENEIREIKELLKKEGARSA